MELMNEYTVTIAVDDGTVVHVHGKGYRNISEALFYQYKVFAFTETEAKGKAQQLHRDVVTIAEKGT